MYQGFALLIMFYMALSINSKWPDFKYIDRKSHHISSQLHICLVISKMFWEF